MLSFIISLLAGALLTLAFSPFNIYTFAFILPPILLGMWLRATPKKAFWQGFVFGLGLFGTGASWVFISIHRYGNASTALAALITFLFVTLLALFIATQGYMSRKFFSHLSEGRQALLVFPALWTLWEFLRSVILTGFPWLLLGYSQLTTPLRAFAPIIGIYGLTLITAFICGILYLLATKRAPITKIACFILIFIIVGLGFIFENHAWTKPIGKPIKVSLIQGNIPQTIKWDPSYIVQNINVYKQLTSEHLDSQLIVWPEGAFPLYVQDAKKFMDELAALAKKNHSNIIFGAPIVNQQTQKYYNGLVLIGDHDSEYLKRHLVPFGEYTPLPFLFKKAMDDFQIPMSDFSKGPAVQKDLMIDHIRIAPFICYEIAFPMSVLDSAKKSELLLTVSDDSWFGQSLAMMQQLQMTQMRSLETGRYQLLTTNTGVTAFISPFGQIIKGAPIGQRVVLTDNIQPMTGNTPLMKWHYYPVFVLILLMLIMGLRRRARIHTKN